ncbi:MAG: hypothetical protein ACK4S3_10360, partial [Parvibaculum sp.]
LRGWIGDGEAFESNVRAIERGMDLASYKEGDRQGSLSLIRAASAVVRVGRHPVEASLDTALKFINARAGISCFLAPQAASTFESWCEELTEHFAKAGWLGAGQRLLEGLSEIPSDQERADRLPRLIGPL